MAWFRAGGGNGIPNQLKDNMDEVLNKKFGTSTTYPPGEWPDDVNLLGVLEEKTTTKSAIAHIDDGADRVPVKAWGVTLGASLDGYSSVDVVATGKNLFNKNTVENNTWIVVNDTTTESANGFRTSGYIPVKANTKYYVSTKSSNRSAYYDQNKNGITYFSFSGGASFTCLYDGYIRITINNTIDLDTFIVNEGNEAIEYEPFGTTYTASLGRTIYGGEVDVVKGTGKETYARAKISDLTWSIQTVSGRSAFVSGKVTGLPTTSPKNVLCDVLTYDGEKTIGAMTDKTLVTWTNIFRVYDTDCADVTEFLSTYGNGYIVYPLATPTDFTFTPITAETAMGVNNFWADEGDSQVTYRSSGTETIIAPDLTTKSITANGTYNASSDNADGYSQVTVNVTPPAVQTVQYDNLSFNGDLYIELPDNLVSPNHSYFIDFTTETQADATGEHAIFGIKNDYYVNFVGIRYNNLRYQVGQNGGSTNISNSWDELTGRHTFLYDGAGTVYFDTDAHTYSYNPSNTIGDNIPIVIGSATATPRMGKTWKGLIHRFTIRNTSTNTLVADYVPAAKQSGQTIVATGLLDLVSNNFVTTPACSVSNDE